MSVRHLLVALAAASLASACADSAQPAPDLASGFGTLNAALGFDGPTHDVTAMHVKVVAAGEACDAAAVAEKTVGLEAELLPIHLEPLPPGGTAHPFADALFVLAPGDYHVCATPLTDAGDPSTHCQATEADATVAAEQTTEILLYAQCLGDPTGALDVIVALNDPPHIDDFLYEPSKFITVCESLTVTALASDPNGDALSYFYGVADAPGSVFGVVDGPSATLGAGVPGLYQLGVVVDDGHGASTRLLFPFHVSDADCGYAGPCCEAHEADGCDDQVISSCVCTVDPTCCTDGWGPQCVGIVNSCSQPLQCEVPEPEPTCADAGTCTLSCVQAPGADPVACAAECAAGLSPEAADLFDAVIACSLSACGATPEFACIDAAVGPGGACEAEATSCLNGPTP